ncbi:Rhomboid family protein [Zostera marina]|uniref:RHOMBOID-like protein n=1 Tax=Zostera marina TaxID=29655 RepID=A0A0K9PKX3_ZOSMR|nr:Rhomboid family protein [Zostera marina]
MIIPKPRVITLIVIQMVVFVVTMYVNNCTSREDYKACVGDYLKRFAFQPIRENPIYGASTSTLMDMGASDRYTVVDKKQAWRLFTSTWLHAGFIQLLTTTLTMVVIGVYLECQFGFLRIGVIYIVSGFGGSVISALFNEKPTVASSAAVCGLLGAMFGELIINWTIYSNKCAVIFTLLIITAINTTIGIVPRIDIFSLIGGFLTGLLLGMILLLRPQLNQMNETATPARSRAFLPRYKTYQLVVLLVALSLFSAGYAVSLVMLFKGKKGDQNCSWCHYFSCIPTASWSCKFD